MHDLAVVIQTETFSQAHAEHQQTNHKEKKYTERQREKGENSSAAYLVDDILCILSIIFFSSAKMDRISIPLSLFLSGMTASLKSPETPFLSLYPSSSPPSSLWRIFSPNFMNYLQAFFSPHLLSYFLISA